MSQENVEIVRAATEAFNRGDLEAWLADADPEIEWHVLPEAPDPGPHRGRHVVLARARLWQETLADFRAEVEEFIDAGEYVIAPTRMRGRPPGSDVDVVLDEVYVSKLCDGKIIELREYRTRAEALEAVGLRE
jgi:ketosteroid isomerase-like protein